MSKPLHRLKISLSKKMGPSHQLARPCQMDGLFVKNNGDVYPCCLVWGRRDMLIGNVKDADIIDKIKNFDAKCGCEQFRYRKATPDDRFRLLLNIEFSLACQGKCVMCCVEAPTWKGTYDSYDGLEKILDQLTVTEILAQGGEVLIQKMTLEWLARQKEKYPGVKIGLVTNGNAHLNLLPQVEAIFQRVVISIVGFETETYKKIMAMEFEKTIRFAEELIQRGKAAVDLKYLITPINLHESNLFLEWAIRLGPQKCHFAGAAVSNYINMNTHDHYWKKIFDSTGNEIRETLLQSKDSLMAKKMRIGFDTECKRILGISDLFIEENGLNKIVYAVPS